MKFYVFRIHFVQTASHQSQNVTNGGITSHSSNLQAQAEENLVSSSSPNFYDSEPKVVCVAVQTPNKLLKGLVANKVDKGGKPSKEHDAQIAAQVKKEAELEFKQFTEKVNAIFIVSNLCSLDPLILIPFYIYTI